MEGVVSVSPAEQPTHAWVGVAPPDLALSSSTPLVNTHAWACAHVANK